MTTDKSKFYALVSPHHKKLALKKLLARGAVVKDDPSVQELVKAITRLRGTKAPRSTGAQATLVRDFATKAVITDVGQTWWKPLRVEKPMLETIERCAAIRLVPSRGWN